MTINNAIEAVMPVFEDGIAQPVFKVSDGKAIDSYNPRTSSIARYCVYVETDYDMDGDGKRDLVKVFVQVPRAACEGHYKAATLFEARPYNAGTREDAYDHLKEVEDKVYPPIAVTKNTVPPRTIAGYVSSTETFLKADPSEWHYMDTGSDKYAFVNIDGYDYYLERGFAVVESAGLGTYGSEGFECVGTDFEKEAFKCIVEWIAGQRVAFTDKDHCIATTADWSNKKVAMTGRSYAGTMPFAVATTGVEALKTIVPVAGIASWYDQQNQQGAQRYWPKEVSNSLLAYYCSSIYSDPHATKEHLEKVAAYHYQMASRQIACGFDYDEAFWGQGNYAKDADKIACSALIVHGLNDENVSTKQFDMMFHAFKRAGQNVKLLLHQGNHMTPTMALKNYGIRIDGKTYDDIVNRWISHYLYDIDNGAQDFSEVLVQDNRDQDIWHKLEAWDTHAYINFTTKSDHNNEQMSIIGTDFESAGITAQNYDERLSQSSSCVNVRMMTEPLREDITLQGVARIDFRAALHQGNPQNYFDAKNINDADTLTFKIGTGSGRMDDVKMTFMLCDVFDKPFFKTIHATDPNREDVETELVEKGAINGMDEVRFKKVESTYKVICRSYIDLCNPQSGYASETSVDSISLEKDVYHDYHIFMNAQRYTISQGHRLVLVATTEDINECLLHKEYEIGLDEKSILLHMPVAQKPLGECDGELTVHRAPQECEACGRKLREIH